MVGKYPNQPLYPPLLDMRICPKPSEFSGLQYLNIHMLIINVHVYTHSELHLILKVKEEIDKYALDLSSSIFLKPMWQWISLQELSTFPNQTDTTTKPKLHFL